MNAAAQPNPAQVPTLTEVIELLSPAPVREDGLNNLPRPAAPNQGSPEGAPIVTGGLMASQQRESWSPMTTVVVPSLDTVRSPAMVPLADLPVLNAVVAEPAPVPVVAPAPPQVAPVAAPIAAPVQAARVEQAVAPAQVVAPPVLTEPVLPEINETQLAQRVLADVQRQIDGMLDFRLKEAIGPILAKHSEALVRDLREELSRTMRDVVARSVTQEIAKLRQR
ncbi:MAG TPA: hypothetical protein VFW93_15610 [Aquabacterium sp.]|uniref:hypothetical protein n=1 Tax=Aquabacterium sp. TaxID=1872578 RepID=UPI002E37AC17|nr:hypothetical protein [Aquabacterium sp.]HEX5357639.1 hypothetical protein [Aquabacterium sp.]